MTKKLELIFVGAGGFAKELYYWMKPHLKKDTTIRGFLSSNNLDLKGYSDLPPHLGEIDRFQNHGEIRFVLAVGDIQLKKKFVEAIQKRGGSFFSFIHPTAIVTPTAIQGEGTIICPLSVISNKAVIGNFVTVNTGCAIGHDTEIGDFSVLSPMSGVMGGGKIGKEVFLGANSIIGPKVQVGPFVKVSSGASVLQSIPENCLVAPTFPRIVKFSSNLS